MSQALFVLVVDDDAPSVRLLCRYLDTMGYTCETASNGAEALAVMRANPDGVGIVLLDLAMPEVSGFDVCRAIRADAELATIPVVAITANVDPQFLNEAIEAGANGTITKPFTREDLQAVLAEHFGSR